MSTSSRARLWRLRPGTQVHARGDGLLQVGSAPGRRALVPDTTGIRGLLHLLSHGVRSDAGEGLPELCSALHQAGVLIAPHERAMLSEARADTRVHLDLPSSWAALATELVTAAGLGLATPASDDASVVLRTVGSGQGERDVASNDIPVLYVRVSDERVRLGPFVEEGRTACPECVESHLREADPWHATSTQTLIPWATLTESWVEPLLLRSVLTSAVFDLVAWAEGRQPLTWSATRWFDSHQRIEHETWSRHPHCGCAWVDGWAQTAAS